MSTETPKFKYKEFPSNYENVCTFLGGMWLPANSVCAHIPKYHEHKDEYVGDLGNIVGMIRLQATVPRTVTPFPSKYRRDQYMAIVYPFRGATWQEPARDLSSYRFLPVTKEVAEQVDLRETDKTIVPISMHGNLFIEAGGFGHNSGEELTAYLGAINTHNKPYRAGDQILHF